MHTWLPRVKLVALLRDPAARAYSSFYHHCDRNSRLVLDAHRRVVFNADCARVEHCCCSTHDLAPTEGFRWGIFGGLELAKCNAESFEKYLSSTEADPESPMLGTILRKVIRLRLRRGPYGLCPGLNIILVVPHSIFRAGPVCRTARGVLAVVREITAPGLGQQDLRREPSRYDQPRAKVWCVAQLVGALQSL